MSQKIYEKECFAYHGTLYGIGTTVRLSERVRKRYNIPDVVFKFVIGYTNGCLIFCVPAYFANTSALNVRLEQSHLDKEIVEVIDIVPFIPEPLIQDMISTIMCGQPRTSIGTGVFLYSLIMAAGLLFYAWYLIWIVTTIIFVLWLYSQYRK